MRNSRNGLRSVCTVGLVLASLAFAKMAVADSISDLSAPDSATTDPNVVVPTGGLNGWFFSPDDPQFGFPVEPDPSQPWTSPANIATLNYWLSLVEEIGDDPSLLQQLYGLGMITSPDTAAVSDALASEETSAVPEPAALLLFGGGLAFGIILYKRRSYARGRDDRFPSSFDVRAGAGGPRSAMARPTTSPGLTCKHGSL